MIARICGKKHPCVFGLDHILSISPLDKKFKMPKGLTADEFFEDCYGVYRPDDDQSVLLSDIDSEISDSAKDQVVIKFKWKFSEPYVWKIFDNHRKRFTDKYNETYD